jgi:phosphoglycerate dehydrogenase-like enzyme
MGPYMAGYRVKPNAPNQPEPKKLEEELTVTAKHQMTGLFCTFKAHDRLFRLTKDFDSIKWQTARSPEEVAGLLPSANVMVLNNRICTPELGAAIRNAPRHNLAWIHFVTAGVEKGLAMGLPQGVLVSSAAGTNGPVLAEHAVTLLLASMRRLGEVHRAQTAHEWRRAKIAREIRSLEGSRVCIIGLGAVGREVARKLRAFDADVIAVSRSGSDANVSEVYAREHMAVALKQADALVICTHSDPSTYHLIGAPEFAAMKPGGFVVNMARGEIIDEAALIEALRSGHLAGAGLDVTEVEPPTAINPLWDMPSVILSPHVSGGGSGEAAYQRQADVFRENLRRFLAKEPLLNAVDVAEANSYSS